MDLCGDLARASYVGWRYIHKPAALRLCAY